MFGLPILRWLPEMRKPGAIRADVLAGLTGAVVVLPQGVAFATLAGMPPQYGLYSAMVPCLIAAIFGSSRLMVTGPANAISLMTMSLVVPLAMPGTPDYVSLVLTLTFMVGITQFLLGLCRAGRFVDIVPHSVVVGFTAGAAVLIINSQLAPALGIEQTRGLSIIANLQYLAARLPGYSPTALVTCIATALACVLWRPWSRVIPALLVGVLVGSAIGHFALSLPFLGGFLKMVAPIPSGWPPLSSPDLSIVTLTALALPALTMTLIALTEAMAIARGCNKEPRQARCKSGDGRARPGQSGRCLLLVVPVERLVQSLRCQRAFRCEDPVIGRLRGNFSGDHPDDGVAVCDTTAARRGVGVAIPGGMGPDRCRQHATHLAI